MKRAYLAGAALVFLLCSLFGQAQQTVATNITVAVPPLVNFSGMLADADGKPMTGTVAVTFSLYSEQTGGPALWMETQNVQPDGSGRYTVMLGSTSSKGLPSEIFVAGEAHWLGVRTEGEVEQPRVLLVSAPYALKAGDAETIGGLPPSAFVLAAPASNGSSANSNAPAAAAASVAGSPLTSSDVTTTGGTVGTIAVFSTATNIQSSLLTQTGTTAINVKGILDLPASGTATATAGKNSRPQTFAASAYNSATEKAVMQTFQWQAEPANNDTFTAGGTLNLLFGSGTSTPAETGLNITSNGQITFAQGQTFPGTGTITGVTAGSGLSGGGTSGNLTLNNTGVLSVTGGSGITLNGTAQNPSINNNGVLTISGGTGISISGGQTPTVGINTAVVPQLNVANTFTGNQTANGNLTATGVVSGTSFQIGSNLFAFGSYSNQNALLGFAGNSSSSNTGVDNTASGFLALAANTTGYNNAASGAAALEVNTTGYDNTASGAAALEYNTSGSYNTASGEIALQVNTTGSANTAVGDCALCNNTSGAANTAAGFNALYGNISGSYNTAVGYGALSSNLGSPDHPQANTAIGNSAGSTADGSALTGSNNTAMGTGAKFSTGNLTNATAFGANAEVSANNAMVLGSINGVNGQTASVNVGIGTTAPAAPLDIAAQNIHTYIGAPCPSVGAYAGIAFGNSALSCTNYSLQGDGTNTYLNAPSGGEILFRVNNLSGPSVMEITSGGLVGIGTNAPDAQLSVDGAADKPGGGSWGTFSDRRLKNLNGNFRSGLNQILKIRPVRYRYKPDNAMGIGDTDEHIGVVAQEVQRVIPEAVTENSKGYLLVNNDPIIWAMLNAIKEQQQEIKQQQQLLRAQATAMRSLKADVREARETLRQVKAQIAAAQPALVAAK